MRKVLYGFLVFVLIINVTGCASLSRTEQERLYELKSQGISETEIQKKNPGVAGVLNLLPGFGNFYLAVGTNEGDQWLFGFLNLLSWPLSILWGVPEAAIDAGNVNKKETVYYYSYDKTGKAEYAKRVAENNSTPTPVSAPNVNIATTTNAENPSANGGVVVGNGGNLGSSTNKSSDFLAELKKLEDLRKDGTLTEDEFQTKKKALLEKQK